MNASSRSYSMTRRAKAVEANRLQIQRAVVTLAEQQRLADISLAEIADLAGVSVRTLLRHYDTKENLFRTVADEFESEPMADRPADPGDVDMSLRLLGEHYESSGRLLLMLLSQEDSDSIAALVTARGKDQHRQWVCDLFELDATNDAEQVDLLVVCTDLYTWKLLRHDRNLSRDETIGRIAKLVNAVRAEFTTRPHREPEERQ